MNIIIERPGEQPAKQRGGCSAVGIVLALVVMAVAAWATAGIDSPFFWIGWIVFFGWLEWFLVVKCGWRPHWWGG